MDSLVLKHTVGHSQDVIDVDLLSEEDANIEQSQSIIDQEIYYIIESESSDDDLSKFGFEDEESDTIQHVVSSNSEDKANNKSSKSIALEQSIKLVNSKVELTNISNETCSVFKKTTAVMNSGPGIDMSSEIIERVNLISDDSDSENILSEDNDESLPNGDSKRKTSGAPKPVAKDSSKLFKGEHVNILPNDESTSNVRTSVNQSSTSLSLAPRTYLNCCVIDELIENGFNGKWEESRISNERKAEIIVQGRPFPNDSSVCNIRTNSIFKVTRNDFKKFPWLTACMSQGILLCWPCSLIRWKCQVIDTNLDNEVEVIKSVLFHSCQSTHESAASLHLSLLRELAHSSEDLNSKYTGENHGRRKKTKTPKMKQGINLTTPLSKPIIIFPEEDFLGIKKAASISSSKTLIVTDIRETSQNQGRNVIARGEINSTKLRNGVLPRLDASGRSEAIPNNLNEVDAVTIIGERQYVRLRPTVLKKNWNQTQPNVISEEQTNGKGRQPHSRITSEAATHSELDNMTYPTSKLVFGTVINSYSQESHQDVSLLVHVTSDAIQKQSNQAVTNNQRGSNVIGSCPSETNFDVTGVDNRLDLSTEQLLDDVTCGRSPNDSFDKTYAIEPHTNYSFDKTYAIETHTNVAESNTSKVEINFVRSLHKCQMDSTNICNLPGKQIEKVKIPDNPNISRKLQVITNSQTGGEHDQSQIICEADSRSELDKISSGLVLKTVFVKGRRSTSQNSHEENSGQVTDSIPVQFDQDVTNNQSESHDSSTSDSVMERFPSLSDILTNHTDISTLTCSVSKETAAVTNSGAIEQQNTDMDSKIIEIVVGADECDESIQNAMSSVGLERTAVASKTMVIDSSELVEEIIPNQPESNGAFRSDLTTKPFPPLPNILSLEEVGCSSGFVDTWRKQVERYGDNKLVRHMNFNMFCSMSVSGVDKYYMDSGGMISHVVVVDKLGRSAQLLVPSHNPLVAVKSDHNYCKLSKPHKSGRFFVEDLIKHNFLSNHWTHGQRVQILKDGGPSPVFFTNSRYDHENMIHDGKHWLVSVRNQKAAVCWPCLLFGQIWSVMSNDNSLIDKINSHRDTSEHDVSCTMYWIWSYKNIEPETKLDLSQELLKCLIDTVCFMQMRIDATAVTTGDFLEVLRLVTAQDTSLRRELNKIIQSKKEMACSGISTMDNHEVVSQYIESITKSVSKYMHSKIIRELKGTDYVCLILSRSKNNRWVSVVLRYVIPAGDVVERFITNVRMESDTPISGSSLFVVVLKLLRIFDCENKLIAYALDGAVLKPQGKSKFVSLMTLELSRARQFHYRAHDLRTLLLEELSELTYLKVFCHQVHELMRFIVHNELVLQSLKRIIDTESYDRIVRWNLPSEVILLINSHYSAFVQIFDKIVSHPEGLASEVVDKASKFLNVLQHFSFRFFIATLSKILCSVECLAQSLNEGFDVVRLTRESSYAIISLNEAMKDYPVVFEYTMNSLVVSKNVLLEPEEADYDHYKLNVTYQALLIAAITHINTKTAVIKNWCSSECQLYYALQFPPGDEQFTDGLVLKNALKLLKTYKISLTSEDLFEQLKILQNKFFEPLRNDPLGMIKSLKRLDLQKTMSEYYRFLELILTVPMVTTAASNTRMVDKAAAYVAGKASFTTYGWIWINNDLLTTMKLEEDFYTNLNDAICNELKNARLGEHQRLLKLQS